MTPSGEHDTSDKNIKCKLNVIDLFCGCGGMSKGLSEAGLNIIAGIDIWDKAIESYRKNFDHLAICEDLIKLSPEQFDKLYNKEKSKIDLIVGALLVKVSASLEKEILKIQEILYLWNMLNI